MNYLIFPHNNPDTADQQHVHFKLHLLDQLGQSWLQRNLNDYQFNNKLLNVALEKKSMHTKAKQLEKLMLGQKLTHLLMISG